MTMHVKNWMSSGLAIGILSASIYSGPAWGLWGQVINEYIMLLASDGAADDQFGWSIAIDNGIAAVSAYLNDNSAPDSGAAYVFDVSRCSADINGDGAVDVLDFFAFVTAFAAGCP